MIVLDANVLIAYLDNTDSHHGAAIELLDRRFVEGFSSSVLNVAEALVHPTRANRHDAALASLNRIGVRITEIETGDALGLARVRSTYKLRMPDAVALHSAMKAGAELATFDESLIAAAQRAGVTIAL